jgi:hypothetical protein
MKKSTHYTQAAWNCELIPKPPQDANFRMYEQIMSKAQFLLMVAPLKTNEMMGIFYSYIPAGLF